jgi:Na+/H+-dicarboxylate symporter
MSRATLILLALVLGLSFGIAASAIGGDWVELSISVAEPVGKLWLNALQMTIIPLVVSLLITGIAAGAEAARSSRLAARSIVLFVALLALSSIIAAMLMPLFLSIWPLPATSGDALRSALQASEPVGEMPGFSEFLLAIVPTNALAAAVNNALLPLIIFTATFAFALTRLPVEPRERLTGFFRALSEVMLVMVGWMLWLAPIGVFALAYVVGARAGGAAFGALLHYVGSRDRHLAALLPGGNHRRASGAWPLRPGCGACASRCDQHSVVPRLPPSNAPRRRGTADSRRGIGRGASAGRRRLPHHRPGDEPGGRALHRPLVRD